jgi:hypothetical protein
LNADKIKANQEEQSERVNCRWSRPKRAILGSKGGEKIESSKNTAGEFSYRIAK